MWWLALMTATAADGPAPEWSDLTPWRTWAVLEHVDKTRHWFVVARSPKSGERCEIGLPTDEGAASVWCGPATLGVAPTPGREAPSRKAMRRARLALADRLGVKPRDVANGELAFVGTMTRVSFRQVVPMGQGEPAKTPARTLRTSWDVEASGIVHPAAASPQVRVTGLCTPGLHPDCTRGPRLLDFVPPPEQQGHLVGADGSAAARGAIERAVVAATTSDFDGMRPGEPPDALLPQGFGDHLAVKLQVQAMGADGEGGDGRFEVDVPLRTALKAPVRLTLPVAQVPAAIEVEVDLPSESITLRIRPTSGRFVEQSHPLRCDLLVDEGNVALPAPCEIASEGRWLRWDGPGGLAMVQVASTAGARLVGAGEPGIRRLEE